MLAIGCDHGGFRLKQAVMKHLDSRGVAYKDFGSFDEGAVDYPDIARAVGKAVAAGECERGILICGTGIGISIAANKIPGIRCALCSEPFSARMTREHNDANILALGGRVLGDGLAADIVDTFLGATFQGAHHTARIEKIHALEREE